MEGAYEVPLQSSHSTEPVEKDVDVQQHDLAPNGNTDVFQQE
jgi:hypothetical protein